MAGQLRGHAYIGAAALAVWGLLGCPGVPPTTGGTTDVSATDGAQWATSTEGQAGVDETGADGEEPFDHRTYFIAETVTFEGGGACNNTNLNTITKRLRNRLDDAGWTGIRFVDGNTWPEDFREASLIVNGADDGFGDAYRLSVYAGHGNVGFLQWGQPSDNGACSVRVNSQARLGRLAGDTAAAVMLMTSCTLRTDALWPNFQLNAARQVFGFHNSPYIEGGEPRRVFKRTQDGESTKDAWLDEMEKNIALGKNSPVVLTAGVSGMEAMAAHGATNLSTGAGFVESVGEPVDAFFFEWLNNGMHVRVRQLLWDRASPRTEHARRHRGAHRRHGATTSDGRRARGTDRCDGLLAARRANEHGSEGAAAGVGAHRPHQPRHHR